MRRLRLGEVVAALAAAVLLVDLFGLSWYSVTGVDGQSMSGWNALSVLRWVILITIVAAFALAWFQATRRAPALPASLSTITTVLGTIVTLALIWRVLISLPGPDGGGVSTSADAGAYLGLFCALVLAGAGLRSLREEDPPDPARNEAIEVVPLRG